MTPKDKELSWQRGGGAMIGLMLGFGLAYIVVGTFDYWSILLGIIGLIVLYLLLYIASDELKEEEYGAVSLGMIIGLTSGVNAAIVYHLWHWIPAIIAGIVGLGSATTLLSHNKAYQFILSLLGIALPLSWLVVVPGLLIFILNLVLALIGFNKWEPIKVSNVFVKSPCAVICMEGGFIRPMFGYRGFNMGNFIFLVPNTSLSLVDHEIGHTLNLAALGSIFHYIGAIDETVYPKREEKAFAEYLAQSMDEPNHSDLALWKEMNHEQA